VQSVDNIIFCAPLKMGLADGYDSVSCIKRFKQPDEREFLKGKNF
jgi:hypothetical protein